MRVSIGTPVYNGEKYTRDALDPLLAQTFANFELTVSDNASTDGTDAIRREYAARDPRIPLRTAKPEPWCYGQVSVCRERGSRRAFYVAAASDPWNDA